MRLMSAYSSQPWEALTSTRVPRSQVDKDKQKQLVAKLFHDLNLMEKEGSGFDKVYDILLSQGRPVPKVSESHNTVILTLERCPPDSTVVNFISAASGTHSLRQMDRIVLGLITEGAGITARSLAKRLGMDSAAEVKERIEHLSHCLVPR